MAQPNLQAFERRRAPRIALRLEITLHGEHNFYQGLSENLSDAGVFVVSYGDYAIGERIALQFSIPTKALPIFVLGEVRWRRTASAIAGEGDVFDPAAAAKEHELKPGVGIQFVEIAEKDQRAIRRFLALRAPEFYEE